MVMSPAMFMNPVPSGAESDAPSTVMSGTNSHVRDFEELKYLSLIHTYS